MPEMNEPPLEILLQHYGLQGLAPAVFLDELDAETEEISVETIESPETTRGS